MEAWILALATRTLCESGQYEEAVAVAERAIDMARECSNSVALGWAHHELAATRSLLGDHAQALRLGEEAVRIARRNGVRLWEGWACTRLAQIQLRAGRARTAEIESARALDLLSMAADPIDRARALALHAAAVAARGDTDTAARERADATETFRRAGLPPPTLTSLFSPDRDSRERSFSFHHILAQSSHGRTGEREVTVAGSQHRHVRVCTRGAHALHACPRHSRDRVA